MQGRANRIDGAGELGQKSVTGVLDYAAAIFCNGWLVLSSEVRAYPLRRHA
jgi:hypothetical protein